MALDEEEHLRHRKKADNGDEEINPVREVQIAAGKAGKARVVVDANERDAKADERRERRFRLIVRGHAAKGCEGEGVEGEVFGGPEFISDARKKRGDEGKGDGRKERAHEGGHPRDHKRVACAAVLGHRIAVERSHHRRLVAGDVEKDRRDPPAIHRPVIDRSQQDERGGGIKPHGEGDRDKDRHAIRGPEARKRADDSPEKAADNSQKERHGRKRDLEAEGEVGKYVHGQIPSP